MEKIEWNDSYLLGITEIDNQHKKLLKIANDLFDAVSTSDLASYKLNMSKVLKSLTDYTEYHFSFEEKFMSQYGYAGSATHKLAHDNFITEVTRQLKTLSYDSTDSGLRFYDYIVKWVLLHIAKADRLWAEFVLPQLNK